MGRPSSAHLLVLHGLRVSGMSGAVALAHRHGLDPADVEEHLLDQEATGLVSRAAFAGLSGWTLTGRGKAEAERLVAAELDEAGARGSVTAVHADFVPLNERLLDAMSRWQVRPSAADSFAANDHTDWAWDERVLRTLASLSAALRGLEERLVADLDRFGGYGERFAGALAQVDRGRRQWVDEPGLDSAHTVWFQLHEDLLATLGLSR